MNIRRKLALTLMLTISALTASAQFAGDGYYRVYSCGMQTTDWKNLPKYYTWVEADRVEVSTSAGTGQKFEAIRLRNAADDSPVSEPASIIYVSKNGNYVDLSSQGTSVSDMTSYQLSMTQQGTANSYTLSVDVSGMTLYLWAYEKLSGGHYIASTIAGSSTAYRLWAMEPVSSTTDNYFGITPMLEAGGKYYQPFYAEFPFKFASTGMKAYYVDGIDTDHYSLKEITSEVKPGGTPILIECSSDNATNNRLELLRGNYAAITDNKLSGVYFCNDFYADETGLRTTFDASTMRVWNVENGQLVLSTATDHLHSSYYKSELKNGYLNANQSYIVVPATASKTLTQGATGIENATTTQTAAKPVGYTTLDGKVITAPRKGQGPVIVRYSDGKSRTVVY